MIAPELLPGWLVGVVDTISFLILLYFSALQLVLYGLLVISFFDMRRRLAQNYYADHEAVAKSHFTFPISVLMPAYNEAANIVDSAHSVLSLDYPQHELIIVNDGSTDDTLPRLTREFGLVRRDVVFRRSLPFDGAIRGIYRSASYPNLTVVDKEHRGKSEALNCAINLSRFPLFCSIDADSIFQENALLRVVRPFLEDPDRVVAVGGQVRVANGCRVERGRVVEPRLPQSILAAFERVRAVTDKPMSASPNAGFKTLFTPAYMADYARRFLNEGALIVGACCGSTPEHIQRMARSVTLV